MENLVEMLVPISFFTMVALIVYFTSKYQYLTRKTIIEKGGNIEFPKKKLRFLEVGGAAMGLGLGMAVGAIIQTSGIEAKPAKLLTAAMMLMCGGIGLLTAVFVRRKIEREEAR